MSDITVLIVDDHEIVRRGLRMILSTVPGISVVGEADSGAHALAQMPALKPHVVLTDARMPGLDGAGLARQCASDHPTARVLVLTTFDDQRLVRDALDAGAAGFLLKDVSTDTLTDAIRQVHAGGLVLDPRIARAAVSESKPAEPLAHLNPTEQDVAALIARGYSNAAISAELHLAHGTVKNVVSALLRKLAQPDRTALALSLAAHRR